LNIRTKEIFHIILPEDKSFRHCESCWNIGTATGASEGDAVGNEEGTSKGRAEGKIERVQTEKQLLKQLEL
jgi:hypothetical protein